MARKKETLEDRALNLAYLKLFANCAVDMMQLTPLFDAGRAAYRAANGGGSNEAVVAMLDYAEAHNIPHNNPGETLASIMQRGLKTEWSGRPAPDDPDNVWIDDETGARVRAE